MKGKTLKIAAAAMALVITLTPLTAQAKNIASSNDMLPKDVIYDPSIDYAFPNNKDIPFETTIEEEGYYAVDVMSPMPSKWDMVYHATSSQSDGLYVDTFSGKMRHRVIYAYPGYLNIYCENPFYVTINSIEEDEEEAVKPPEASVLRFYNDAAGEHLFTTNFIEAVRLLSNGWTYEGIAFKSSVGNRIYRNYDGIRHSYSYDYRPDTEGYAFRIPESAHLLVSPYNDTLITEDEDEYWHLLNLGWEDRT